MLGRMIRSLLRGAPGAGDANEEGIRLWQSGDLAAAEARFREALERRPGHAPACSNLGMVLVEQRRLEEGLERLGLAVVLDPGHAGARINFANTLYFDGQVDRAIEHYREAMRLSPEAPETRTNAVKPFMDACEWRETGRTVAELLELHRTGGEAQWMERVTPFISLLLPLPADFQRRLAVHYAQQLTAAWSGRRPRVARARRPRSRGKIRVAYLSPDFGNHALAHLTAGMFERHDRSRFEVFAYSFGYDDASYWRKRIAAGCDHFVDIAGESFEASAVRIARDGIDIAVDLAGYTGGSRSEICALRPAPIQVQWLGYPGTMGAEFIDYLIADRVALAQDIADQFTESIAWLPRCYQVNDGDQPIADATTTREQAGLPREGFVFCSFNQSYKIEPEVFACWMRLLGAVGGSVLWLFVTSELARQNLRRTAQQAGVAPERLVFAATLPKPEHLARHRLADLFLDTWIINAGTTASDALWAGLPVLTCPGRTLGSRVAASLVHAIGLPELVAASRSEYERIALELARDPAQLAEIRRRLDRSRLASPLFDTAGFVRDLECAYELMWTRHARGEKPASFRSERGARP